ncbi:MAG: right-handed parallel beta-helix repeat-containing protein [bacterium]|nr:right-handed parallel beta-helix repeat-containing protein [bacterium]
MRMIISILLIAALSTGCGILDSIVDDPDDEAPGGGDWEHPDYNDTIVVSNVNELLAAVERANSEGNIEILLEDGTYQLDDMLWIDGYNVGFRGRSGDRDAVIVRGDGMEGAISHVFNVPGDYFNVEDMTIGWVSCHGAQIHGNADADYPHFDNVHFVNTGEQMLKVSSDFGSNFSDGGIVENCSFEYTAGVGPQYYIGGIDGHQCNNWTVRDNYFYGIRSPDDDLAEHAIHFWSDSGGTVIERNRITECDRGIGFGMGDSGHGTGIIRNNFVHTTRDVGIGLENASGVDVYNNSLYTESYGNSIEYRFGGTGGGSIINNLTNAAIVSRDGGSATVQSNVTSAQPSWFADAGAGDLHLTSSVSGVVDSGQTLPEVTDDFDGQERPIGEGYDIGGDEVE